jgi:peptidyl-prolyl cis-trans isomerase A (cyclophilin A)
MRKAFLLVIAVYLFSCSTQKQQQVKIEMKTKYGSIIAELYPEKAPVTCANFIKYIKDNKFEGLNFYRVVRMDNQPNNKVKIEVIQGGLGVDEDEYSYPPIPHETTQKTGVLHKDGVISMARLEPGTASSEFFICIGDQPELDFGGARNPDGQGFAAFGKVIQGMDVVKQIQHLQDNSQSLINKVEIPFIRILE